MTKNKKLKKRKIYLYLDSPVTKYQINNILPRDFEFYKDLVFINTSHLNYKKKQLRNFYKKIPNNEIPKNMINFKNLNQLSIFINKINKNDIFIFLNNQLTLKNSKFGIFQLFNIIKCKKILISEHSWIFPNLQKNFFLNTFRTIKFIIHKFFFSNHVEKTQFNHVLTFGELNKKKENKYLDFPSFWIKFNLKKRQKSLITYVDENFDYSNDIYLFRDKFKKKINDRSLYIRKLNYFFSQVEKKYRCKIIICCKKRFRYKKNYFDGRKIVYGKTHEYISKSKFVIGHKSDALFQALYSKTPVVLLKSKEFKLTRNLAISSRSINLFNKKSEFLEDYNSKKEELDISLDKVYYKKILNNHFISKNQIQQNFHEKLTSSLKKLSL